MARVPGPILTTQRLVLRTPRLRDVPDLYRWCRDAAVNRHLSWDRPNSPHDTVEFIRRVRNEQRAGTSLVYVLHERDSDRALGCCGAHQVDASGQRKAEVGYWLARPWWGRGLMPEALAPFLAHLFEAVSLHRLYAQVFVRNRRSARLLRSLGFQYEGTLRHTVWKAGRAYDAEQYSLLRTDRGARRIRRAGHAG